MTDIVPAEDIERIIGVPRHPALHWGRAISSEQTFYILHSRACQTEYTDLRRCPYSQALDLGIFGDWPEDSPVLLMLREDDRGRWRLIPNEPCCPIPVNAAGDGPETDESKVARVMCMEHFDQEWPCKS